MTRPLVSVVLPTYNRGKTLLRAIRSVLGQTAADLELIVVDDGSTDNTDELLGAIEDPRLVVLKHAPNRGAAAARNIGIAAARADWVAFQDSDDEWLSEKLERQMAKLSATPEHRACYTGRIIYGLGAGRQVIYTPSSEANEVLEGDILPVLCRRNLMANTQLLVARNILEDIGGYDETLGNNQDWDIVLRIAKATPFLFVDEPMVVAFTSDDSISKNYLVAARTKLRILEKYAADFAKEPKTCSTHYFYAGLVENRYGDMAAARRNFARSVSWDRRNLRAWAGLAASRAGVRIPERSGS